MNGELRELLYLIGFAVSAGLVAGLGMRKFFPDKCKSYTKFSLSKQWKLFLFGTVLFLGLSILSFSISRPYFGILFLAFACFEIYVLFVYGFKGLSVEQEAVIDASDPSKFRPFKFWR